MTGVRRVTDDRVVRSDFDDRALAHLEHVIGANNRRG